jgi:predicted O-methyltransferase YrrM
MQPIDFAEAYLSISKEQGKHLKQIIVENDFRSIVEFGTSFGVSTLFLAQGVMETQGHIITTELLGSKALRVIKNFNDAGVDHLIEVRIGDA